MVWYKAIVNRVPTIIFIGLAVIGYVAAWFKESPGGIMMMIGGIGQGIYLLLYGGFSDIDAALIYMLPLLIPLHSLLHFLSQSPQHF